ncbi:hypothetical protein PHYBOEH_001634 [Phytophthora boehmeriae]|uniref:PLAC8 family protein n=1 Tax=Phytophthora boehmeriae TaxID=109152 RepID=A0A8T1WSR2_9STRA|nr:hypothetical protein PHYBOEH_001634 [Phytophthora boehmeriae]
MSQPQTFTSDTPSKPAEVQYAVHADVPAAKDLESEDELTRGQWAVGFWDCFTDLMPNCFMVTCCSCVSMAQISARLGVTTFSTALIACLVVVIAEFVLYGLASTVSTNSATVETSYGANGQTTYTYSSNDGGAAVIIYRGISVIIRVVFALFVCHLRTKTRERFEIPGSSRTDFFASLCCSCCALAQMATHVKSYTPGSCDFRPVADTLPPYTS